VWIGVGSANHPPSLLHCRLVTPTAGSEVQGGTKKEAPHLLWYKLQTGSSFHSVSQSKHGYGFTCADNRTAPLAQGGGGSHSQPVEGLQSSPVGSANCCTASGSVTARCGNVTLDGCPVQCCTSICTCSVDRSLCSYQSLQYWGMAVMSCHVQGFSLACSSICCCLRTQQKLHDCAVTRGC
jgi:hypothetical protein